jgi:hypothetical protein
MNNPGRCAASIRRLLALVVATRREIPAYSVAGKHIPHCVCSHTRQNTHIRRHSWPLNNPICIANIPRPHLLALASTRACSRRYSLSAAVSTHWRSAAAVSPTSPASLESSGETWQQAHVQKRGWFEDASDYAYANAVCVHCMCMWRTLTYSSTMR